jgi:hypothetical protein
MNHNLKQPCPKCPFRTNIKGYLTKGAIQEIVRSVKRGESFPCHETTVDDEDDEGDGLIANNDSEQCAGAEIFLAHNGSCSQLRRIAERVNMPVAELDMKAPVVKTTEEMLKVHGHKPKRKNRRQETCSVVDEDCEAPAGYMEGGEVVDGDAYADYECYQCGLPVCGNCSRMVGKKRMCNNCLDEH